MPSRSGGCPTTASPGEAGLLGSLLAGRAPVIALEDGHRLVASGRMGTERRGVMRTSFDDALIRTVSLLSAALAGRDERRLASVRSDAIVTPGELAARQILARTGRILAHAVAQRLYHLCYHAPHWRVGWRHLAGPDVIDLRRHPETGWTVLPDDGRRFYADPFPLDHRGETWLFVEDYIHAIDKGIVSAVKVGADGPVGVPVPVLEEAHHLSYPFVFVRAGEVWMVPESGSTGTIDLYRATAFPGGLGQGGHDDLRNRRQRRHPGRACRPVVDVRDGPRCDARRSPRQRLLLGRAPPLVGTGFPRPLDAACPQPGAGRRRLGPAGRAHRRAAAAP